MVPGLVSSASKASSRIRSKPKPASSGSARASSFWRSSRSITRDRAALRRCVMAMRSTLPSARKKAASNSRTPRPSRSRISLKEPRQAEQRGGDGILGDDRFGETLLGHQVGQGAAGLQRLFFRPQHDLQPGDEALAQPLRQFAGQPFRHHADRLEPGMAQGAQSLVVAIQRRDGQGRYGLRFAARRHDGARAKARQGARRQGCAGNGAAHGEALIRDPSASPSSASPLRRRTDAPRR